MLNFVEMGWKWESNYKWKWNGTDLDLAEWDGMEWELKTCPMKGSSGDEPKSMTMVSL